MSCGGEFQMCSPKQEKVQVMWLAFVLLDFQPHMYVHIYFDLGFRCVIVFISALSLLLTSSLWTVWVTSSGKLYHHCFCCLFSEWHFEHQPQTEASVASGERAADQQYLTLLRRIRWTRNRPAFTRAETSHKLKQNPPPPTHTRTHTHSHIDCSRNWVLILVRMEILWQEEGFSLALKELSFGGETSRVLRGG